MKRVVYIISNIDRWIAFEWIADSLKHEYKLSFVLLNNGDSFFEQFLQQRNIPFVRYNYRSKKDLPRVVFSMFWYFRKQKPQIVHTHFLDANLAGLMSGWLANVPERIHTRHHSVFHLRFHKKGQIYDILANRLSTKIVAISENVRNILTNQESVDKKKIELIHHGFDLSIYQKVEKNRVDELRTKYNIPSGKFIIGVVSRYIEWKGVEYIIHAFTGLLKENPNVFLILMNARGPHDSVIKASLNSLPYESYIEIPFEKEMHVAYHMFDCFVHFPIDQQVEAFGQVYIEAMAAGIPSVVSLSGIANDYIVHRKNAIVVPHCDSFLLKAAMKILVEDVDLQLSISIQGQKDIEEKFNFERMKQNLLKLYGI